MNKMVQELKRHGICVLPAECRMPLHNVDAFLRHFEGRQTYDKHVKVHSTGPGTPQSSSFSWSMEDVLLAPHWLEMALTFTPVVAEYLDKSPPLLYSVNAFVTNPIQGPTQADIQEFHRDADDSRFVALFMYCTEVLRAEDGAHEFKLGSQDGGEGNGCFTVLGPAGTMFLADTRGFHRGIRPAHRPRMLAWARWGVSDPPASYSWDQLAAVEAAKLGDRYPTDPYLRDSLRLVVR